MNLNYKLFFKYILFNSNQVFFKNSLWGTKQLNLVLNKKDLYFLTLHLKLSSLFYPLQLVDLFIYETPISNNLSTDFKSKATNGNDRSVIVYNFQVLSTQQRFFIFVLNSINSSKRNSNNIKLKSITNLFLNAN